MERYSSLDWHFKVRVVESYDMCLFLPLGCIVFDFCLRDHRDVVDLFFHL